MRVHLDTLIRGMARDRVYIGQLLESAGELNEADIPSHLAIHCTWQSDFGLDTLNGANGSCFGDASV